MDSQDLMCSVSYKTFLEVYCIELFNFQVNTLISQVSFQLLLSTDGTRSFATFIYADLHIVQRIIIQGNSDIGFDAGDLTRSASVLDTNRNGFFPTSTYTFRIDGILLKTLR